MRRAMDRESISDYEARWRSDLLFALLIGLPFTVLVPSVARAVGAAAIVVVLVLSFRELLRIDRTAFASIAIPSATAVALGFALPRGLALGLDVAVAAFLCLFAFARGSFVPWWWRVILRRPNAAFAIQLGAELRSVSDSARPALLKGDWGDRSRASIQRQLDGVRALEPPTTDWSDLRDAYVDQWEATLGLALRSAIAPEWDALAANERGLQARFDELADRPSADRSSSDITGR
jgi:hypothetical protein